MLTIAWCQAVLVKNLLEHLIYKRGIGHTGIYKKLCFRLRFPNWHSRGCKKEQLYTSPETPVIGWTEMSSGPSWCLPEYVALYLSESQLVPTVTVTWGSWDIIRVFSLSITWEVPVCLLLFSSLLVTLSLGIHCCSQVSGFQSCILFLLVVPCCLTL